jgi:hypothetical protein
MITETGKKSVCYNNIYSFSKRCISFWTSCITYVPVVRSCDHATEHLVCMQLAEFVDCMGNCLVFTMDIIVIILFMYSGYPSGSSNLCSFNAYSSSVDHSLNTRGLVTHNSYIFTNIWLPLNYRICLLGVTVVQFLLNVPENERGPAATIYFSSGA